MSGILRNRVNLFLHFALCQSKNLLLKFAAGPAPRGSRRELKQLLADFLSAEVVIREGFLKGRDISRNTLRMAGNCRDKRTSCLNRPYGKKVQVAQRADDNKKALAY